MLTPATSKSNANHGAPMACPTCLGSGTIREHDETTADLRELAETIAGYYGATAREREYAGAILLYGSVKAAARALGIQPEGIQQMLRAYREEGLNQ